MGGMADTVVFDFTKSQVTVVSSNGATRPATKVTLEGKASAPQTTR
jgi:hypothetical protein